MQLGSNAPRARFSRRFSLHHLARHQVTTNLKGGRRDDDNDDWTSATWFASAAAHIATAAIHAVATLEALCGDRDPWVRLKAASKIVDTAIQYNQEALISDRLAALEERARALIR